MANELDKTIEELEAEVISELEEANGTDAPMKSAGKPEKMDTMDSDGATENEGEIGGPTPTKDAKQAGKIDPAKKVKKDSSAPAKTGVLALNPNVFAALPRCVSSNCPKFILDGTPMGFKIISNGVPSGR